MKSYRVAVIDTRAGCENWPPDIISVHAKTRFGAKRKAKRIIKRYCNDYKIKYCNYKYGILEVIG